MNVYIYVYICMEGSDRDGARGNRDDSGDFYVDISIYLYMCIYMYIYL
jgi:hypothetical protein